MPITNRFLVVYSGVLTIVFAATVMVGAKDTDNAAFDEIDVQRINVREPDGTLRMTISSRARQPGLIERGQEKPHNNPENRQVAGMLFFDDEGSEVGGLSFGGKRDKDGKVTLRTHLTMDQFGQNESLALSQREENGNRSAGLVVYDQPDTPISEMLATVEQKKRELTKDELRQWGKVYLEQNRQFVQRVFVGKNEKRESVLRLNDASDRPRLQLRVAAEGEAVIEFLDITGKVVRRLTPDDLAEARR